MARFPTRWGRTREREARRPRPGAARVLHWLCGMNTTPSPWMLTGLVLGSFTAAVLYFVQSLQRAALVP